MARRPLVAGNWKMNGLAASIAQLKAVIAGAGALPKVELMVCPPATLIASFAVAARGTPVTYVAKVDDLLEAIPRAIGSEAVVLMLGAAAALIAVASLLTADRSAPVRVGVLLLSVVI